MRYLWLCGLLLSGCVNLQVQLAPVNKDVPATRSGEQCEQAIILPFLWGSPTVEEAMQNAAVKTCADIAEGVEKCVTAVPPITKVREVELTEFGMPFYTEVCLNVTGE